MVYCATIWGCKACLLLFYANMTYVLVPETRALLTSHSIALPQNTWTKLVAAYALIGYVVMIILYLGVWCQPFYEYWSVPATNPQCSTAEHHLILNLALNTSSDLMIMLIPLPMLIRTNLPLKKKLVLCAVFSLGMFCIICAVLNKYYSFTSPYGSEWVYWYDREASTAVIVANIPHLWVLVRKVFRVPSFIGDSPGMRNSRSPPQRFFGNVADPLGTGVPRRIDGILPPGSLDDVDIDEFMAMDRIGAGPAQMKRHSQSSTLLPEDSIDFKSSKAWKRVTSEDSDRSTRSADHIQLPLTPTTPLTFSSDMRLLPSNQSSPKSSHGFRLGRDY